MTIAQIVPLVLTVSIFLNVLALGLAADLADATYLFRRPALLLRAVLSMNILTVLIVVAAASLFELTFPVKVALLALAVSPVPPLLPTKERKHGATESYAVGLLVSAVVLALVLIPWSIEWIGRYFGEDAHVSAKDIVPVILISVILPLGLGILFHRLSPDLSEGLVRPIAAVDGPVGDRRPGNSVYDVRGDMGDDRQRFADRPRMFLAYRAGGGAHAWRSRTRQPHGAGPRHMHAPSRHGLADRLPELSGSKSRVHVRHHIASGGRSGGLDPVSALAQTTASCGVTKSGGV